MIGTQTANWILLSGAADKTPVTAKEMGHVVTDPRRLRGNFLVLVESLFPEAVTLVEKALERPDQRSQLDAYLASQARLTKGGRSGRRPRRGR